MSRPLRLDPGFARERAGLIVDWLAAERPELLDQLKADPLATVRAWPDARVEVRPQMTTGPSGGRCSVSGYYNGGRDPPLIVVYEAASPGRVRFTALHELAHHLQRDHPDSATLLADYAGDDEYRTVEDRICDAFAAEVLLPAERVGEIVTHRLGPDAGDVIELFNRTEASRAACCVRITQQLDHDGWVILADCEGVVRFAAAAHLKYRLAPGTQQPPNSQITLAGRRGRGRGLCPVVYPSGKSSWSFNTEAIRHGDYVFAVLSLGATPWNPRPVPAEYHRAGGVPTVCANAGCDAHWVAWEQPCSRCGGYECPDCGRCQCVPIVERRLCPGCYLEKPAGSFPDGGEVCEECADR